VDDVDVGDHVTEGDIEAVVEGDAETVNETDPVADAVPVGLDDALEVAELDVVELGLSLCDGV
jgi:hypothetical protein